MIKLAGLGCDLSLCEIVLLVCAYLNSNFPRGLGMSRGVI